MLYQRILAALERVKALPPTIVIYGGDKSNRFLIIKEWLQRFFCLSDIKKPCGNCRACKLIDADAFPDIMYIEGNGKSVSINQVRELIAFSNIKSFSGRHKFGVILDGELLTREAQSSLLKLLEEPVGNFSTIISIPYKSFLLPTIRSRAFFVPIFLNPDIFTDENKKLIDKLSLIVFDEYENFFVLYEELSEFVEEFSLSLKDFLDILIRVILLRFRQIIDEDDDRDDEITYLVALMDVFMKMFLVVNFNINRRLFLFKVAITFLDLKDKFMRGKE
jgi:hypothetical protein